MLNFVGSPHPFFMTTGYRHGKNSVRKPSGNKIRPRTSPDFYSALRHPGSDLMTANASPNIRTWASPRLSDSRMRTKGPERSEKDYLVISPGYIMRRSKSHIDVTLEEEFFTSAVQASEEKSPSTPPRLTVPVDVGSIVEDLQEQIAKLTTLLDQEITDHQKTQKRLTLEMEYRITELLNKNEEEIRKHQVKHAEELLVLQQQSDTKILEEKEEVEKRYEELQKDFDLLKASFRTYQESLTEEMNAEWLEKESKWKETFENEKMKEMRKQKQTLMDAFDGEKRELHKRAQEESSTVQQSYEKQMEETWTKYKEALQEAKKQDMLKMHLQTEVDEKKETILALNTEIQQGHRQIEKLKNQLDEMRRSFDTRVNKVEAKYSHRIHSLLNENADLRRKLITKHEQLFNERNQQLIENQSVETLLGQIN